MEEKERESKIVTEIQREGREQAHISQKWFSKQFYLVFSKVFVSINEETAAISFPV